MSTIANNNAANTPSVGGAPTWGQAGCGSVGYSYAAIMEAMNAMQQLVSLSAEQAQYQAKIGMYIAQGNASATEQAAIENAEATRMQAIGSIVGGAVSAATVGGSLGYSYFGENGIQSSNNLETFQKALPAPNESTEAGTLPASNGKPDTYNSWTEHQKDLYDGAIEGNASKAQQAANSCSKQEISDVAEKITTSDQIKAVNTTLQGKIEANMHWLNNIQNYASSLSQSFSGIMQGTFQTISNSSSIRAGEQQAIAAVLGNAQQINNNQMQTSQSTLVKAYDQELTMLQVLASLAQAARV